MQEVVHRLRTEGFVVREAGNQKAESRQVVYCVMEGDVAGKNRACVGRRQLLFRNDHHEPPHGIKWQGPNGDLITIDGGHHQAPVHRCRRVFRMAVYARANRQWRGVAGRRRW